MPTILHINIGKEQRPQSKMLHSILENHDYFSKIILKILTVTGNFIKDFSCLVIVSGRTAGCVMLGAVHLASR